MKHGRLWRWMALALIALAAAIFASFNAGERVALSVGFTMLYQVPLVPLIFVAFLAGMTTMFLVGLRHDLRVRRALREAGFGEALPANEGVAGWQEEQPDLEVPGDTGPGRHLSERAAESDPLWLDTPKAVPPESEPPPHYPP